MGSTGNVILFMFTLVGFAIVTTYALAYLARCFLTITVSTGVGTKAVEWGDELTIDWLFQGVHVLWMLIAPLIPTTMILRLINRDTFTEQPFLVAIVFGIVIWISFPIAALSSMSATSRWTVLRGPIVGQLLKTSASLGLFYVLTAGLIALGIGSWLMAVLWDNSLFVPPAAALTTLTVFLYARLLGRLAHRITPPRRKKRRRPRKEDPQVPKPPAEEKVVLKGTEYVEPPDPYDVAQTAKPESVVVEPAEEMLTEQQENEVLPKSQRALWHGWLTFFGDQGTFERAFVAAVGVTASGLVLRATLAMWPG